MRPAPRRLLLLVVLALAGGGVLFAARDRATAHVRRVTGDVRAEDVNCMRCHSPGGMAERAAGARPHPTPWQLAAAPDGSMVYVACAPLSAVGFVDVGARRFEGFADLGGVPDGVAASADGSRLAVTLRDRDEVVLLGLPGRNVLARLPVGAGPAGIAFDPAGRLLVVANGASKDVSILDLEAGREVARLAAGQEPFAVAVSPDGRTAAVASRRATNGPADRVPASEVTLVDLPTRKVQGRVVVSSCHMIEGLAFTPDGSRLLLPAILTRNLLPILQVARGWTMASVLVVVDLATGRQDVLPLTETDEGFPDPAGIAVSPDGRRAWIAAGGADQVGVIDLPALLAEEGDPSQALRLSLARRYLVRRVPTASNPRGLVALGPAHGVAFAVSERLADSVALHEADGALVARVALGAPLPDDPVRHGERVFHDARYAFQGHFSCRSCHPGAHTDGLTYDFDIDGIGRNVVLNRSLHGLAGTEPFKWVGSNPTLHRQCGPRFAMVLTRADVIPDDDLDALVAYMHSLEAPRPDPAAGRLADRDTGAIARGKAIFERFQRRDGTPIPAAGRCITCHPPPLFTSGLKSDVGTKGPYDDTGLFDTPHLTGIGSKAPYLHDGRARTLEEIWTLPGVDDHHGVVTDLDKADLNDLVEYLKSL